MRLIRTLLTLLVPGVLLSGCFTGVESTPKITYKDVKNNKVAETTPEQQFARELVSPRFSQWRSGKEFYVTSPRISLVLSADTHAASMPVEGDTLVLMSSRDVPDLTGRQVVELVFSRKTEPHQTFVYRTNATRDDLTGRAEVEIPFTIDLDFVAEAASRLIRRELYVRTPLWFNTDGEPVSGKKFVKVRITGVRAANEVYPLFVSFTDEKGETHGLFMSGAGQSRWVPRDFAALFSMGNPRLEYPQISDAMWSNIVNTRVAEGMTKQEVSLAIGMPENIDRGYNQSSAYERWNYPDGRYLIFEDGLLMRFNR